MGEPHEEQITRQSADLGRHCGPGRQPRGGTGRTCQCGSARDSDGHRLAHPPPGLRFRQPRGHGECRRAHRNRIHGHRAPAEHVAAVRAVRDHHIEQSGQRRPGQHRSARPGHLAQPGAARWASPAAVEFHWHGGREHHPQRTDRDHRGRFRWSVGGVRLGRDRRRGELQAQARLRRRGHRVGLRPDGPQRWHGVVQRVDHGREFRRRARQRGVQLPVFRARGPLPGCA